MKIAATIAKCVRKSADDYGNVMITKVFEDTTTIKQIVDWAKTIIPNADFHSISLSEIVE